MDPSMGSLDHTWDASLHCDRRRNKMTHLWDAYVGFNRGCRQVLQLGFNLGFDLGFGLGANLEINLRLDFGFGLGFNFRFDLEFNLGGFSRSVRRYVQNELRCPRPPIPSCCTPEPRQSLAQIQR